MKARPSERLALAVAVSALIHNGLFFGLSAGFKPANPGLLESAQPSLDVVLLHRPTGAKPLKAEVLAQAANEGGGQTSEARMARSPQAVIAHPAPVTAPVAPSQAPLQQRVRALETQVEQLLTQARADYVAPLPAAPAAPPPALGLAVRSLSAAREMGRIEAEVSEYQQRPRRMFIGARAEEYVFARYIEDWRMKVERVGNLNYPEAARRQKLYGSLMLKVEIGADGRLLEVEVERSSGSRILDAAAVRIVEMAAPFPAFSAAMRTKADILSINRVWVFTREDRLSAQ
jgi:protein TonB